MTKHIILTAGAIGLIWIQPAFADGSMHEMHGDHQHRKMNMHGDASHMRSGMKSGAFMVKKEVDGYQVTFHVMKAPQGMQKGGSHHFMLKVEQDSKPETDLIVNSKVIHPGGQSESKMMMRMGDWYMASYDLGHPGKHQVMVLFKTPDGKKHFGGVYYDPRESQ